MHFSRTSNSDRFQAASRLLASISSYQYTRRSWRREVLDLLYEPVFFQMTPIALQSWNVIIDNLMTQDKNTFKEALGAFICFSDLFFRLSHYSFTALSNLPHIQFIFSSPDFLSTGGFKSVLK